MINVPKQREEQILAFVIRYQEANGQKPSYQQIARSVGLRSKSTIGYYMNRLKSQGRIPSLPEATQNAASVSTQLSADAPLRRVRLEVEEGGSISFDCRIESKGNGEQTVVFEGVLDASQLKREVGCVVRCAVEEE